MSMRRLRPAWARAAAVGAVAGMALTIAGCGSSGASNETEGVTITVALSGNPPPSAALEAFTKETGITVQWSTLDWDSLQTKISAAAAAGTYFADATNVDWSRVGQLGRLGWFHPMEEYLETGPMAEDMPQLESFSSDGHVVGIPYDASFMVTTVNTQMFARAGANPAPATIEEYTAALRQIKAAGVVEHPLNIPFAAAEGLSTYWYQTTAAFGGTVLDAEGKPQFADPSSAGYRAAQWMVSAFEEGLVPPGNINVTDSQGQQDLMAKGQVASTFSDYSGNVGSLYQDPEASTVVDQVRYIPTPGVDGPGPNLNNPDGIGIPRQAKYPAAAAEFIKWFTSAEIQADFAGVNGPDKVWSEYTLPSQLEAVEQMASKGKLFGGDTLSAMLDTTARPSFPGGPPTWYPEFSNAVYTNLHEAAAGTRSVDAAISAIAETAERLSAQS
jgi:multiple sugar transport system substrate-binding protein